VSPVFLGLDEVLEFHQELVEIYGGSHGVRDLGLLQSALAMPQAGSGGEYFHADLFEMAAAYLFHIVKNHPFVDGNKRTGTVAALQFLDLNGIDITAPSAAFEKLILEVARGEADKSRIAEFFRRHGGGAGRH
jgi:death on curing protein